jgi:hypothetical protein
VWRLSLKWAHKIPHTIKTKTKQRPSNHFSFNMAACATSRLIQHKEDVDAYKMNVTKQRIEVNQYLEGIAGTYVSNLFIPKHTQS